MPSLEDYPRVASGKVRDLYAVAATRERYVAAYERISGQSFADWPH